MLTTGVALSAKAIQSQRVPSKEELRSLMTQAGETLAGYFPESTPRDEFATPGEGPNPPSHSQPRQSRPPRPPSEYAKFIAKLDLRYIRPREVIQPHRRIRNGVPNTLPPSHLWDHIPPTLQVADEIRHRLGTPLDFITSAYRCPSYNRQCGGASQSLHMRNNALDLVYASGSQAAFDIAEELRAEGFFRGGLGLYPGFIHIDTRGYNASWTG